jgi:hypothetical protein
MVCTCLAMMLVHFNGTGEMHGSKPVINLVASNENNAVRFNDGAAEVQNHVDSVTFDWTNHTVFQSSIGSHFGPGPSTNFSN